jgi:hypothetical protein
MTSFVVDNDRQRQAARQREDLNKFKCFIIENDKLRILKN